MIHFDEPQDNPDYLFWREFASKFNLRLVGWTYRLSAQFADPEEPRAEYVTIPAWLVRKITKEG